MTSSLLVLKLNQILSSVCIFLYQWSSVFPMGALDFFHSIANLEFFTALAGCMHYTYLEESGWVTVVHALVISKFDYFNGLHVRLSLKSIRRIWLAEKASGMKYCDQVNWVLFQLQPVYFQAHFKVSSRV